VDAGSRRPQPAAVAAARQGERERDGAARPQLVPIGPFWGAAAWYVRGLLGFAPADPGEPAELRWWASRLFLVGGGFAAAGAVAEVARDAVDLHGAWLAGLAVLLAAGAAGVAAASLGRAPA
jgi:hypothetical protein